MSAVGGVFGLKLPNAIDSNMVLQRGPLASRLWGWSNASQAVKISLDGAQVAEATAAADGSWVAELPVQPASTGRSIVIEDGSGSVALGNIAFGDGAWRARAPLLTRSKRLAHPSVAPTRLRSASTPASASARR